MNAKWYLAQYAVLFVIALVGGVVPMLLSGRFSVLVAGVAVVVALALPPIIIWVATKLGYPLGRAVRCSRCGTEVPIFRKPKSISQALHGGYQCRNCGAELDRRGRELAPDAVRRAGG